MRINHASGIVALATVALLGGSMALSAEVADLNQNGFGPPGGGAGELIAKGSADGDIVDVDRKVPTGMRDNRTDICGDLGPDEKCRPRGSEDTVKTEMFSRYSGFCLPHPVLGRLFCWE